METINGFPFPVLQNVYAALDSDVALNFLAANILQNGFFKGECANNPDDDTDPDMDLIPTACDNCPGLPNNSQTDTDGDGVGDACDQCPGFDDTIDVDEDGCPDRIGCDPCFGSGNIGFFDKSCGDLDTDGVCNNSDNCLFAKNIKQNNTNALAEEIHEATILGDACEPVPQPQASSIEPETFDLIFGFGTLTINDTLGVRPQPSRKAPDRPECPVMPGQFLNIPDVPTHFRFCQPNEEINFKCDDSAAVNDAQLFPGLSPINETQAMPYHRVLMSFSNVRGDPDNYIYGLGFSGTVEHKVDWDYKGDGAFWTQDPNNPMDDILVVPPPETNGGPWSGLDGWFWIHAETPVGSNPLNNFGTGCHGEQLANNHFPLDPEFVVASFPFAAPVQDSAPFFIWRTLPDPPEWRVGAVVGNDEVMVASPGGNWGLINSDGSTQLVTNRLGANLQQSLADSTIIWANAAEPSLFSGEGAPIAVGLSADGTSVVETIAIGPNGEGLLGVGDRAITGPGVQSLSASPPAVINFVPAYSRFLRSVYLIGGDDPLTQAPVGTIWHNEVDTTSWTQLPLAVPVGKALAATVSFVDRSLYVIDEVSSGGNSMARLLRFNGATGGGEVMKTWPRLGDYDKLWLELDLNGNLLLIASSDVKKKHALARIRVDGEGPEVELVYKHPRPLAWPILVDENGFVFYRVKPNGTIQVKRETKLHNFGGGWAAIGELL